ncbi:hypothetical protein SASPL_154835 [Salvia splendens]|uniref:THIF-type NAD/FAD binding fold domain-containing protein n=1 Tax=Salvia splendens TaxID=180675 RepID=A0A8X8Z047_SALSN|nr:hypothetical protein SASPL_154835 [Salvia splendens]
MDGEELTEQETALYDRQIRVWGADAQRRLSKSHILVSGLKGSVIEFCKNIVLAGVGSVTLNDDRLVTEELLTANFLVPSDRNVYTGKSLAELCSDSLKDFNPMVRVSVQRGGLLFQCFLWPLVLRFLIRKLAFDSEYGWGISELLGRLKVNMFCFVYVSDSQFITVNSKMNAGELSNFDVDFFHKFDAVVISSCSLSTKKSVNEKCRKSLKRIAFYTVDCRDSCGEIFVDLQDYIYNKKKEDETIECHIEYPTLEEAISAPWKSLPRKVSKLYLALRVIEKFEELEGRSRGEISAADLPKVQRLRKELCDAQSHAESQIPDALLERLLKGRTEFPPVCAIIGGILGQEVIKAISGKGDPLKNFFFFDAMDGKGIIEDIGNPKPK